jgi:hypothetical protein
MNGPSRGEVRVAVVGRKDLYETGGQDADEVHKVGLVIVQLEGIGLAIGAPARGWRGELIAKVVKRMCENRNGRRMVSVICFRW